MNGITEEVKEQIYHCNKCGLCLSECPVYKVLPVESFSPRGKVQLIRNYSDGRLQLTKRLREIISTCLMCETCVSNCPSGVDQTFLFSAIRSEIAHKYGLDWEKRIVYKFLANENLLHKSFWLVKWGRNLLPGLVAERVKIGNLAIKRSPPFNQRPFRDQIPEVIKPDGAAKGKVLYFTGCFTNYADEGVGKAVIGVLRALKVEVEIPKGQCCCGIPMFASGDRASVMGNIKRNIALFNRQDVDAVIVDCATCGSALRKWYPQLLKEAGEDSSAAEELSKKSMDILEFIAKCFKSLPFNSKAANSKVRVTYHDPCHLNRVQKVNKEPRELLQAIPSLEFIEVPDAGACCGGGGFFQFDHPQLSKKITDRKIQSILEMEPKIVATGCPGCRMTIAGNLPRESNITVLHPIQLIEMALPTSLNHWPCWC